MRVCSIVFSPSGHTLDVAERMKQVMEKRYMTVQLINITGEQQIFKENKLREYLEAKVMPHDVLCIGGPVYAGHLESNVIRLIRALPSINNKWGGLVIPFITYGGVHSSIALKEAGDLLYKSGRKNIMGMKIACFHTLTATFDKQINQGKPNKEANQVITELTDRLAVLNKTSKWNDNRKSFAYSSLKEKVIFTLLSQDAFHKKYRMTAIDSNQCTGCGICVNNCPVSIIELSNKKAVVRNSEKCILCAECYHKCPQHAVQYAYYSKVKSRLGKVDANNINLYESPQSAVYPIETKQLSYIFKKI